MTINHREVRMKFGRFDDTNREYVITSPDTPWPWINYLGSEGFFSLISNTAGGYSFYRDARLRRITRYRYNNIPPDSNGRYFYVNDSGDLWTPGFRPCRKELSFYECRHGMGYTKITGERNGVRAEALFFVPMGADCEIQRLRLTNTSNIPKKLKIFSFVEFCLWNSYDDMTNFQRNFSTGEVEIDGSTIYHKTEYRERRDHYSFYSVNSPLSGFDTDRESFLGPYNGTDSPRAALGGKSSNSIASGWSPIASHCVEVELPPSGTRDLVFVLGYIENPESKKWESPGVINKTRAKELIARFDTSEKVETALAGVKKHWDGLLSRFSVDHQDDKLSRMVNIWNQYQCMVTFNLSRSASYFESGVGRGMGFRDSTQDLLGFVHMIPDRARERLLDIAATQLANGGAYHQYQPLTKKGNADAGMGFNDDSLWLIEAAAAYVKETGDSAILDEKVPFGNDPANTGTLFEHCRRSFRYTLDNLGPHGLPLIGRADWNDCLNLNCFSKVPDESFQTCGNKDGRVAESVMIAGLFVYAGNHFAELCGQKGLKKDAEEAGKAVAKMKETILRHAWDGGWFLRAYDDRGAKIGSRECDEGKIFIETQGFCSMAGVGLGDGKIEKCLDSVKELLETKHGIMLQQPAYTRYRPELGEISSYPPGYKENAGIFCHNNPWIAAGETVIGRGGRAFEVYSRIAPAWTEEHSELHKTEPYVYSQMIAGRDAVRHGEAKNSWLTGTASWNFVLVSQFILGLKPDWNGLRVDPCVPSSWKEFTVRRTFRGSRFTIKVMNPSGVEKGVVKLTVDGKQLKGDLIPAFDDSGEHRVEVEMGKA